MNDRKCVVKLIEPGKEKEGYPCFGKSDYIGDATTAADLEQIRYFEVGICYFVIDVIGFDSVCLSGDHRSCSARPRCFPSTLFFGTEAAG